MNVFTLIVGGLVFLLTGCQSGTANPALQTLQAAIWGTDQPTGAGLDPRFAYLRVTTANKVAFLALGYVEQSASGSVEVWYSADRELIRLQNGRLVGAVGTLTEWRQVGLPQLPSWKELADRQGSSYVWQRTRDVMPGYQFNIRDSLQLKVIAPPAKSALLGAAPAPLIWFEESQVSERDSGTQENALPPARYAVDFNGTAERVFYGEQCISTDICLTWQRWVPGQ